MVTNGNHCSGPQSLMRRRCRVKLPQVERSGGVALLLLYPLPERCSLVVKSIDAAPESLYCGRHQTCGARVLVNAFARE
jgi:hypothetical protein